jgi:spermidine synthase
MSRLGNSNVVNSDFHPISYFKQIIFQLSQFSSNFSMVIIFFVIALIFIVIRTNAITLGIFIAGFTSSSVEILVLFTYQVFFGYIYMVTGLFFVVFMSGLSIGSLFQDKGIFKKEINNFLIYQLGMALMSAVYLIYIMIFRIWYSPILIHLFSFIIVFFVGLLMGKLFSAATRMQRNNITNISADTYGFELIGSALGAILISTIMLPLMGFIKVTIILISVNILCALYIWSGTYHSRDSGF